MTLDTAKYLQAVYPPPLHRPIEGPRTFLLKWNNSKGKGRRRDETWHECYGTKYSNGRVTLDFGPPYESMTELEDTLALAGESSIVMLDEMEQKLK